MRIMGVKCALVGLTLGLAMSAYGSGLPLGDMNGDGSVNGLDVDSFVDCLAAGGCGHADPMVRLTFDGHAIDYGWRGIHGVEYGPVAYSDEVPAPLSIGKSCYFDGASTYTKLLEPLPLTGTDYTISFWIDSTDTSAYIVHSYAPPEPEQPGTQEESLIVMCGTSVFGFGLYTYQSGEGAVAIPGDDVFDGEWHHVAITRNVETMHVDMYLDGELAASGVFTRPETIPTRTVLGWTADPYYTPSAWFEGYLDEFQVYDRVLSESEIVSIAYPGGWKGYGGHFYRLTSRDEYWPGAEAEAVAAGGHLVNVNDESEQAWLEAAWRTDRFYNLWIGLTAESGNWEWVCGDPVTYTNWAPGEPSGDGIYGEMNHHPLYPGEWNDEHYQEQLGVIELAP